MRLILKKHYMGMLIPATALFLLLGLARELNLVRPGLFVIPFALQAGVFVLAAMTAVAGPVLIRTVFILSLKQQTGAAPREFLLFQKKLIWVSLTTPYLAFAAVLCDFAKFYAAALVLMALYAVYYYFPSQKRIVFDRKIFRVR